MAGAQERAVSTQTGFTAHAERQRRSVGQVFLDFGDSVHATLSTRQGRRKVGIAGTAVLAAGVSLAACTGPGEGGGSPSARPTETIYAPSSKPPQEVPLNRLVADPRQLQGQTVETSVPQGQTSLVQEKINNQDDVVFSITILENGRPKTVTGVIIGISDRSGDHVLPVIAPQQPDGRTSAVEDIVYTAGLHSLPLIVTGKVEKLPKDTPFGKSVRPNGDPEGEILVATHATAVDVITPSAGTSVT